MDPISGRIARVERSGYFECEEIEAGEAVWVCFFWFTLLPQGLTFKLVFGWFSQQK